MYTQNEIAFEDLSHDQHLELVRDIADELGQLTGNWDQRKLESIVKAHDDIVYSYWLEVLTERQAAQHIFTYRGA